MSYPVEFHFEKRKTNEKPAEKARQKVMFIMYISTCVLFYFFKYTIYILPGRVDETAFQFLRNVKSEYSYFYVKMHRMWHKNIGEAF